MPTTTAPWKQSFISHLQSLSMQTFSLATISTSPTGITSPHVRTLIFRGFYAELPKNSHNPVAGNAGWSSTLLTYTTDKRMGKFKDLGGVEGIPSSSATPSPSSTGNVEACFWIPSPENPMTGKQWRIRGRCVVLPRDLDDANAGTKDTKRWLAERLKKESGGDGEGFNFGKEFKAHFGNLSPLLRGSFRNPLPGAPKELGNQGLQSSRPIGDDNLNEAVALANFRVVVIEPTRVEFLNLEGPERKLWVPVGGDVEKDENLEKFGKIDGEWREIDLWP
ncbi:hypothetical protein ABW19_dt0206055 [Dactylella cylindrospora]|nr:hypothetical protein ABW19_dt0206055 [Dactylella cylindrospora]